jgi:hypothetical protein
MKRVAIHSIDSVSELEAESYLAAAAGDELAAAYQLAADRNILDGSADPPDAAEVHHALFLLRRAVGQEPPSFDGTRLALKRLVAA